MRVLAMLTEGHDGPRQEFISSPLSTENPQIIERSHIKRLIAALLKYILYNQGSFFEGSKRVP
jgi:hypothetical protein